MVMKKETEPLLLKARWETFRYCMKTEAELGEQRDHPGEIVEALVLVQNV